MMGKPWSLHNKTICVWQNCIDIVELIMSDCCDRLSEDFKKLICLLDRISITGASSHL